jgi:hypothetical protein
MHIIVNHQQPAVTPPIIRMSLLRIFLVHGNTAFAQPLAS